MPRPLPPHGTPASSPEDASVTVTVARKVAPGREADFKEFGAGDRRRTTAKVAGLVGRRVLHALPGEVAGGAVAAGFADAEKQRVWEGLGRAGGVAGTGR